MDYDVQKSTRTCAVSGRVIAAGEPFYSVLVRDGAALARRDYAADAWPGPPDDAVGWWKSTMGDREGKKPKLAPSEVLLELFRSPAETPDQLEFRYVLALLLVRRRLLRLEEAVTDEAGPTMVLYCSRDEQTYRVIEAVPDESRQRAIQDELIRLLDFPPAATERSS